MMHIHCVINFYDRDPFILGEWGLQKHKSMILFSKMVSLGNHRAGEIMKTHLTEVWKHSGRNQYEGKKMERLL